MGRAITFPGVAGWIAVKPLRRRDSMTFDDPVDRFLAISVARSLAIQLAVAALLAVIAVI
jgi:hypothetical protein